MSAQLDLSPLFFSLRDNGFDIGPENLLDAERLRLHLLEQGAYPRDPARLKHLLAPIFCSDPVEQREFYRLFEQWLPQTAGAQLQRPQSRPAQQRQPRVLAQRARSVARAGRWRRFLAVGGSAVLLFIIAAFSGLVPGCGSDALSGKFDAVAAGLESIPPPLRRGGDSTGSWQQAPEGDIEQRAARLNQALREDRLRWRQNVGWHQASFTRQTLAAQAFWAGWIKLFFVLAPGLLFLRWLFGARDRRRFWLERFSSDKHPLLSRLRVAFEGDYLFRGSQFAQGAQKLRRQIRLPGDDLDIEATLRATVGQMGLWTPVYGTRGQVPEYLFLVDRHSAGDQLACFSDSYTAQLRRQGVHLDCYHFYRDARDCYGRNADGSERHRPLKHLLGAYPGHRLVLLGDAEQFLDPLSFALKPGLQQLQQWRQRVLMTPRAFGEWGTRETVFWRLGWLVVPATDTGIRLFSQSMAADSQHGDWRPALPGWLTSLPSLPPSLRDDEDAWFDEEPKPHLDPDQLLAELREYLDEFTFQWWAACSIYPELNWHLTLFLGAQLARARHLDAPPDALQAAALLRLPWFRRGSLPQYLRRLFLQQLEPGHRVYLRRALQGLLQTALLDPEAGFDLEIAGGLSERRWRRLFADYRASRSGGGDLDTVFVGFMTGRDPGHTGLAVDRRLQRWLGAPLRRGLSVRLILYGFLAATFTWVYIVMDEHRFFPDSPRVIYRTATDRFAYSTDGQVIAVNTLSDEDISLRLITPEGDVIDESAGASPLTSLAFSPQGRILAGGSVQGKVYIRDRQGAVSQTLEYPIGTVIDLTYSDDGDLLALLGDGGTALLAYSERSATEPALITLQGDGESAGAGPVTAIDIAPGGRWIALGGADGAVQLRRVDSDSYQVLGKHAGETTAVAFSPDGRVLASSSIDRSVRLWNIADRALQHTFSGHRSAVRKVVFSPGGQLLASIGDSEVCLWDSGGRMLGKRCLGDFRAAGSYRDIAFSADGKSLFYTEDNALTRFSLLDKSLADQAFAALRDRLHADSDVSFAQYLESDQLADFERMLATAQAGFGVEPIIAAAEKWNNLNSLYAIGRIGFPALYSQSGDISYSPALLHLLSSVSAEDAGRRAAAAWALGRVIPRHSQDAGAIGVLVQLLSDDPDESVRRYARAALADIGAGSEEVERALLRRAAVAGRAERASIALTGARLQLEAVKNLDTEIAAGAEQETSYQTPATTASRAAAGNDYERMIRRADLLFKKGSYKSALAAYIEAAEQARSLPGGSEALAFNYIQQARCLLRMGQYNLAVSRGHSARAAIAAIDRPSRNLQAQLRELEVELQQQRSDMQIREAYGRQKEPAAK